MLLIVKGVYDKIYIRFEKGFIELGTDDFLLKFIGLVCLCINAEMKSV